MAITLLIIGLVAGVRSGLFGVGGGIVIVPALVALANFRTKLALGTSLGAVLLPVGILGASLCLGCQVPKNSAASTGAR